MIKLFFIAFLAFLTGCATTCNNIKVEKEKKACYDRLARQHEDIWIHREFNTRR